MANEEVCRDAKYKGKTFTFVYMLENIAKMVQMLTSVFQDFNEFYYQKGSDYAYFHLQGNE